MIMGENPAYTKYKRIQTKNKGIETLVNIQLNKY